MPHVLAGTALVGFAAIWLVALIAWVAVVVYGIKAIRRARPGISLLGRGTLWNPANVLLSSNMLTAEGMRYRRKCFASACVFVACVGTTLLVVPPKGAGRNLGALRRRKANSSFRYVRVP
jgi:hypothetical protein